MNRSGEGLSGGETTSKRVPHGEPYAGKLHVRFDEGAGVPHGAVPSPGRVVEERSPPSRRGNNYR